MTPGPFLLTWSRMMLFRLSKTAATSLRFRPVESASCCKIAVLLMGLAPPLAAFGFLSVILVRTPVIERLHNPLFRKVKTGVGVVNDPDGKIAFFRGKTAFFCLDPLNLLLFWRLSARFDQFQNELIAQPKRPAGYDWNCAR